MYVERAQRHIRARPLARLSGPVEWTSRTGRGFGQFVSIGMPLAHKERGYQWVYAMEFGKL